MMENTPQKHCNKCDKDFPATEEYFFRSYLNSTGHNICKVCHNKQGKISGENGPRKKLLADAQLLQQDDRSSYQSLALLARTIGYSQTRVERDVYREKLQAFKFLYNNSGMSLAIRQEDAEAYIAAKGLNGHKHTISPTAPIMDTSDRCGACGTTRGNILGDVDEGTHLRYGCLCAKCYRLVRDYQGDVDRLRNVLDYIERTRVSRV